MKAAMASFFLLTVIAACSSHRDKVVKNGDTQAPLMDLYKDKVFPESVEQHIAAWPQESRDAVTRMMNEHGVPSGVTKDMLVWDEVSPYRSTIIYKDPIRHQAHRDVKEHLTTENGRVCEYEVLKTAELAD